MMTTLDTVSRVVLAVILTGSVLYLSGLVGAYLIAPRVLRWWRKIRSR